MQCGIYCIIIYYLHNLNFALKCKHPLLRSWVKHIVYLRIHTMHAFSHETYTEFSHTNTSLSEVHFQSTFIYTLPKPLFRLLHF